MHLNQIKIYLTWTLAFILASVILCSTNYQSTSNDSKYYSTMITRYQDKSWPEVLSAKWGENYWGFEENSYMRDQLPGQVGMGVLLAKLGVPAKHALHILEMAFLLGSFFVMMKIASLFMPGNEASLLVYALLILPLSFSYNIRANHESGILFFSTLALYSGLKLSSQKVFSLVAIFATLALMWIKGPFLVFGFILTTLGFLLTPGEKKYLRGIVTELIAGAFVLGSALLYEKLFFKWTGEPFFSEFWRIQIQERAMGIAKHPFFVQKYLNFQYYFIHYLGYALPWVIWALYLLFKTDKKHFKSFLLSPASLCFGGAALAYLGVFSMSERIAGRYVFPGYYFFSAWLILLCFSHSEWFRKYHEKLQLFGSHYLAVVLWLIAFGAHFI